jgi:hypothetical protein
VPHLFRKNPEKEARKAAARREVERVRAMDIADLAEALMPAFGPEGPTKGASVRLQQLCEYLLTDFPGAGQTATLDLRVPTRKALDLIHDAGLISPISVQREPLWRITPLGEVALAEGTVRRRLTRDA